VAGGAEDLDARLERLELRAEITELLARYCRALDTRDRDLFDTVFAAQVRFRRTADGTFDSGRDALWSYIMAILGPMGPTLHTSTNSLEVSVDGDGVISSQHVGLAEHAVDDELVRAALTYRHGYRREVGEGLRIVSRLVEPWYFARASDLQRHYGSRRGYWWRGDAPPTLPESSPAWQAFHAAGGPSEVGSCS
jgi:hypothetical protein